MKSPRTMRILVLPSQVVSCLMSVDVLRATTASSAIDDFSSTTLSALIVVCGARLKTLANALSARCSRSLAGRRTSLETPQIRTSKMSAMPTYLARTDAGLVVSCWIVMRSSKDSRHQPEVAVDQLRSGLNVFQFDVAFDLRH